MTALVSNFSLFVQVSGEWGKHVGVLVIMIVIIIAVTLDVADLPFRA
ncbi:hypothetical protein AB0L53_30925 [Nonomuraea sp. NPDC052129]